MTRPGFELTNLSNTYLSWCGVEIIAYYDQEVDGTDVYREIKALHVGEALVHKPGDVKDWCETLGLDELLEEALTCD